jgi:hypothetical protein
MFLCRILDSACQSHLAPILEKQAVRALVSVGLMMNLAAAEGGLV